METKKVGIAVFGVGRAGQYHLPNLESNPDVAVTWLVDVDVEAVRDRARQLCDRHDLNYHTQFVPTDDCHKVFDDPETVAIVVTTPTKFHEDITKRALRAGKDVFCEKPISFTSDVLKSCFEEADKHGRILFCGFNKRFDEQHVQLRQQVRSGLLGSPRIVYYNWRDPATSRSTVATYIPPSGGIFCDSAIHQLDYVPWMLGEKPCSLVATGGRSSEFADVFEKCDDVDCTLITLRFPSGAQAVIEIVRELHIDDCYFRIEVVGTKATELFHKVDKDTVSRVRMDGQQGDTKSPLTFWSAYKHEMDCFVRVIQGKEECPVLASEVIQANVLADLCLVSLKEGRVVDCSYL